jgi:hypothetical protein
MKSPNHDLSNRTDKKTAIAGVRHPGPRADMEHVNIRLSASRRSLMPSLRCGFILLSFVAGLCVASQAQDREAGFPTDEEIKLVLTQADRAIQEYKPLLDEEEQMYGKRGEDAVAKDREVVRGIEMAIKGFGKNPQAFNGPLGFSFFEWLDDADRNALLCASGAATEVTVNMLAGG